MALRTVDFGSDIAGVTDMDPAGRVVTGRRLLAEATARRLITPRGRLIDDPDYGTDITEYINDDVTPSDIAAMQAAIIQECTKDERVDDVTVSITPPPGGSGVYEIAISLDPGDGPFDLVLGVSEVTVDILSVE